MRGGTPCPVCGEKDGACGDTPLAFPPITSPSTRLTSVANENKVYVPQQHVRRGKAGYKMKPNLVVVDEVGKPVEQGGRKSRR